MISRNDLEELKAIIGGEELNTEAQEVPVLFDGKQFSARIPKRFCETLEIKKSDRFCFTLQIPKDIAQKPKLSGELVRDEIQ